MPRRSSSARNISSSTTMFEGKVCLFCSRILKKWGTRFTMFLVLVFGFGFNFPRWFEWEIEYVQVKKSANIYQNTPKFNISLAKSSNRMEELPSNEETTNFAPNMTNPYTKEGEEEVETEIHLLASSLGANEQYILHYQLIASCIVMILVPAVILLKAYCAFRKATPSRANKNKTHKIMLIIISMFVICHCPKVK